MDQCPLHAPSLPFLELQVVDPSSLLLSHTISDANAIALILFPLFNASSCVSYQIPLGKPFYLHHHNSLSPFVDYTMLQWSLDNAACAQFKPHSLGKGGQRWWVGLAKCKLPCPCTWDGHELQNQNVGSPPSGVAQPKIGTMGEMDSPKKRLHNTNRKYI